MFDIAENRQATLRAKRHLHSRPSLKSVQILRLPHDCAEPTRERAWSILVRLYQIAAIPFPGQQLNTKNVHQGIQTNCHHARSRLHPRALTEDHLEESAYDSPFLAFCGWIQINANLYLE